MRGLRHRLNATRQQRATSSVDYAGKNRPMSDLMHLGLALVGFALVAIAVCELLRRWARAGCSRPKKTDAPRYASITKASAP